MGTCQPMATSAPHRQATGPQAPCDFWGVVPVREVQNNLGTETVVLRSFMGTDERKEFLAFVLRKDHRRCFRTRHITIRATEDMQGEVRVSFYEHLAVA